MKKIEASKHDVGRSGSEPARIAFRRIAACVDGSELGERVLPHAFAVAKAFGAPLTLVRALECGSARGRLLDPIEWDLRRKEAREYLERLTTAGGSIRDVQSELIEGPAAEQICSWARHHEVELTVLCTHGERGQSEWSLASTARKLVDRAPGSLLLVPASARSSADVIRYRRILVPVDGSPSAESVLPVAAQLAAAHDAELLLAHVVPIPEFTEIGPLEAADIALRDQLSRRNDRVANLYLDRLREQLAQSAFPVRAIVINGHGGDVRSRLLRLITDESVDLVVLSAHGRTARSDAVFGNVTAYLVTHASTPLFVVRRPPAAFAHRVAPKGLRNDARLPSQAST